jgi:hypothetical protein
MVISQTSTICPIRARVSLILSKYPTWCRSTFEPCCHDITRAFVYPSCLVIQENVISDRFNLEVITPMGDVILDVGVWESSFPFRASDWVNGPRRSSNVAQHKESHESQSESTRCYIAHAWKEKLHGKLRSFLLSMAPISSFLRSQCIFHHFLCPSFVNLGMRFLLRRRVVTPRVMFSPNYFYLKLNHASSALVNKILIKIKGIRFNFDLNFQSKSRHS